MGRSGRGGSDGFEGTYEGPEVLSALLADAGSPYGAEEVADHFREAQAAGEPRSDVIPSLFPDEPRFASPVHARRLYSNLFGLWERIASGQGAEDVPAAAEAPRAAPPPERGSVDGRELPPAFVEAAWRWLAALSERETNRLRDRFSNTQPDVDAWLGDADLPETGGLAAHDLVFETWAMFDQAFDERLAAVDWQELEELQAEPPPLESVQPALADYVAEQLDNLEDEDPGFGAAERAQVERVLATAGAAFTRNVAED
ncbi:MAG TPA: hypothetical protein VMT17_16050 [Anaeromyxobacteraceae bacterium]|nr:hypothetical protein [Anaeromyxobacteraceae bacterium]